jgi:hypothetical protein
MEWNQKLHLLAEAQQEYERQRQFDRLLINEPQSDQILGLATDFDKSGKIPLYPAGSASEWCGC